MAPRSRGRCRQQARQDKGTSRQNYATYAAAHAFSSRGAESWAAPLPIHRGEFAVKGFYPLVSELAAEGIPAAVSCRVLKFARQPYYSWLSPPISDADLVAAYWANAPFDAHRGDPEFGYSTWPTRPASPGILWPHAHVAAVFGQFLVFCPRQRVGQEREKIWPAGP